jgi:hypothetical protein
MYEVVNGITVGDKYFAEGEIVDNKSSATKKYQMAY